MKRLGLSAIALICCLSSSALAQKIVDTCNAQALSVGSQSQFQFMDKKGNLCVGASVGSTVPSTSPIQITLDVKTVTIGGTAVTAIAAGNRPGGGFLQNPPTATINLCINEIGVAVGVSSFGDTTCIIPGQGYVVQPGTGAVSVITSDSAHQFSGYGLK